LDLRYAGRERVSDSFPCQHQHTRTRTRSIRRQQGTETRSVQRRGTRAHSVQRQHHTVHRCKRGRSGWDSSHMQCRHHPAPSLLQMPAGSFCMPAANATPPSHSIQQYQWKSLCPCKPRSDSLGRGIRTCSIPGRAASTRSCDARAQEGSNVFCTTQARGTQTRPLQCQRGGLGYDASEGATCLVVHILSVMYSSSFSHVRACCLVEVVQCAP
jgi:hypothetical protein